MDCALWLNKHKVFSADEIPSNFDIAAIRGYFLGGSLIPWLREHGGEHYAAALEELSPSDKLNDKLAEIFGQKRSDPPVHRHDEQLIAFIDYMKSGGSAQGSFTGSNGAYNFGSMRSMGGSFSVGSYSFGSYRWGSYNFGSYNLLWEWEWEWYLSSFRKRGGSGSWGGWSSFSFGSFNGYGTGSFNFSGFGSMRFAGGSFNFADVLGSYRGVPLNNSCSGGWISSDEYDEIMYRTLGICPLDRYGYGIHII